MLILGLTKTTLLDYPGKVAATVFTGGCNFRCPFCHNGQLVLNAANEPQVSEEEVFEHLKKRRNILEGVCITGGEPTIQADLTEFIAKIKEMGYFVKLDTNGTNPSRMKELIDRKLIDYVAMDVKNSKEKYPLTAKCTDSMLEKVEESIKLLLSGCIDYEFRTTVVNPLHTKTDMEEIAKWIDGASSWYIQSFKESEHIIGEGMSAYSKEELLEMIRDIRNIPCSLRGIE